MLSPGEVAFAPLRLTVYGSPLDRASRDGFRCPLRRLPYRESRPRRLVLRRSNSVVDKGGYEPLAN
jgi:hypothetical protein